MNLDFGLCKRITENISHMIVGKKESIDLLLAALLADGHVPIKDIPGLGKTFLAKSLASSLQRIRQKRNSNRPLKRRIHFSTLILSIFHIQPFGHCPIHLAQTAQPLIMAFTAEGLVPSPCLPPKDIRSLSRMIG
jgi:hypothetical protein